MIILLIKFFGGLIVLISIGWVIGYVIELYDNKNQKKIKS